MNNGSNGSSVRAWWWLVGALLVPIVLATFGNLVQTTYTNAERVSGLESAAEAVRWQLQRIEQKLDRLLERR